MIDGDPLEGHHHRLRHGTTVDDAVPRHDDYRPATLGDPSEGGATDRPIAWLRLEGVGRELIIDTTMWAPAYGWSGTPYDPLDCRDGLPGTTASGATTSTRTGPTPPPG